MNLDFGNFSVTIRPNSVESIVNCESHSSAASGIGKFLLKGSYTALNAFWSVAERGSNVSRWPYWRWDRGVWIFGSWFWPTLLPRRAFAVEYEGIVSWGKGFIRRGERRIWKRAAKFLAGALHIREIYIYSQVHNLCQYNLRAIKILMWGLAEGSYRFGLHRFFRWTVEWFGSGSNFFLFYHLRVWPYFWVLRGRGPGSRVSVSGRVAFT